jgi:hypothetical protein
VPDLVEELGVAEAPDRDDEAVEILVPLLIDLPLPDNVLVRGRLAVGDGLTPPARGDETSRPRTLLGGWLLEKLREVELTVGQGIAIRAIAHDRTPAPQRSPEYRQ